MSTGKVYVGWIMGTDNPVMERKYVKILLLYTGYREVNTNHLKITCSYKNLLNKVDIDNEIVSKNELKDYEEVLPYNEIESANIFKKEVYNFIIQNQLQ